MKIKPLGNRVLVKPFTEEEKTKAGIILPDTAQKEKKAEGEVLALGEGKEVKEAGLKKGDKVLFSKYGGDEVEVEKDEFKILEVKDILAIIE